jgi:hypothetical protein
MDLFSKKDPTRDEYIIAHSLTMLGMKKIGQEKVDKIVKNDDIKYVTTYPSHCFKRSNKIGVTGLPKVCLLTKYMVKGQGIIRVTQL